MTSSQEANPSILARVRSEGYRDGWGQAAMLLDDATRTAYENGRIEGRSECSDLCWLWWMAGCLCGLGLYALLGVLT